jgi:hypothetical protein
MKVQGILADWPKERQARTIDAAYDLLRFRKGLKKDAPQDYIEPDWRFSRISAHREGVFRGDRSLHGNY